MRHMTADNALVAVMFVFVALTVFCRIYPNLAQ